MRGRLHAGAAPSPRESARTPAAGSAAAAAGRRRRGGSAGFAPKSATPPFAGGRPTRPCARPPSTPPQGTPQVAGPAASAAATARGFEPATVRFPVLRSPRRSPRWTSARFARFDDVGVGSPTRGRGFGAAAEETRPVSCSGRRRNGRLARLGDADPPGGSPDRSPLGLDPAATPPPNPAAAGPPPPAAPPGGGGGGGVPFARSAAPAPAPALALGSASMHLTLRAPSAPLASAMAAMHRIAVAASENLAKATPLRGTTLTDSRCFTSGGSSRGSSRTSSSSTSSSWCSSPSASSSGSFLGVVVSPRAANGGSAESLARRSSNARCRVS